MKETKIRTSACKTKIGKKRKAAEVSKPKQTLLSFFTKRSRPDASSSESHHATVEADSSDVQPSDDSATATSTQVDSTVDVDEHGVTDEVEDAHAVPDEDQDAALSLSPTSCQLAVDNVVKCAGFIPDLSGDIYQNFPFQLLLEIPGVVFETNVLHNEDWLKKECMLQEGSVTSNNCCTDSLVVYNFESKQKLLKRRH